MGAPLVCRRIERRGTAEDVDAVRSDAQAADTNVASGSGAARADAAREDVPRAASSDGATDDASTTSVGKDTSAGASVIGTITLDETDRHRRRLAMTSDQGLPFVLSLDAATLLRDGDRLVLDDGRRIVVRAAPEPLYEVRGTDAHHLLRLAWHMGNRHLPTQLMADHLRIRRDAVIGAMLHGLGADVREVEAGFDPEGGAYGDAQGRGHGRTHTHGHADGNDAYGHDHAHEHGHAHEHERADDPPLSGGSGVESEGVHARPLPPIDTTVPPDRRHDR